LSESTPRPESPEKFEVGTVMAESDDDLLSEPTRRVDGRGSRYNDKVRRAVGKRSGSRG